MLNNFIYISGPLTTGAVLDNLSKSIHVAADIFKFDEEQHSGVHDTSKPHIYPILPHISSFQHIVRPMSYERWMEYDLALLHMCCAVYRIEGESGGADREVEASHKEGIHVLSDMEQVKEFYNKYLLEQI